MPQSDRERLSTLEQVVRDVRKDLREAREERNNLRKRMHTLEGSVRGLDMLSDEQQKELRAAQRRTQVWIQVLTLVVAAIGVLSPFLYAFAHH